ncbi:MAG: pyridoxal-dependent decarboxylase [Gemmatimonadetes bacterium]|nr:pyridoxal-dependent decarboxylase [Candidatus Palauibacter australiensis]
MTRLLPTDENRPHVPNVTPAEPALRAAADHAIDWLAGVDRRPVAASRTPPELRHSLDGPLPEDPSDAVSVIGDLVANVEGGLLGCAGGRFYGWVIGGAHPAALAADWLVSTWDQNAALAACSPAEAVIEEIAGRWVIELLGLPDHSSFAFPSGCQLAHVTALAAARRHLLLGRGHDPEREGLGTAPQMHVVTGTHGHHSVDRAVRILGIGSKHLHAVPTTADRLDVAALDVLLTELEGAPVAVCLSAGDINTGNFDDFRTVIPLCRSRGNTWVHVDGAFGLWAKVSPHFAHLLEGVDEADSWATDAHKWLNTPFDIGFVAIRHPEAHRGAMSVRAPYLTHAATARDQLDWNPEWSRRGRGVPVYAAVKALGRRGIAEVVERCSDAAANLVEGIGSLPGAEVLSPAVINQALVRFRDPAGSDHDGFTDRVIAAIQAEGTAWFGGTDWRGMRAMRISVCCWATGSGDVRKTVGAVERVLTALEIEK